MTNCMTGHELYGVFHASSAIEAAPWGEHPDEEQQESDVTVEMDTGTDTAPGHDVVSEGS